MYNILLSILLLSRNHIVSIWSITFTDVKLTVGDLKEHMEAARMNSHSSSKITLFASSSAPTLPHLLHHVISGTSERSSANDSDTDNISDNDDDDEGNGEGGGMVSTVCLSATE